MSMRHQAGIVLPGYNALKVANAPTIGTATSPSGTTASVVFTAPACVGGGAISSYTAFANCGLLTASGASSPLTVTGLTTGTTYTFKVIATNVYGPSYPSAASNSVTPVAQGQDAYVTAGTYSWVAPAGVTSASVIAVGAGGGGQGGDGGCCHGGNGGGGGALRYVNNITVIPGNAYAVVVGAAGTRGSVPNGAGGTGGTSSFNTTTVTAGGGRGGPTSTGGNTGTGTGGNGGAGGNYSSSTAGGGGGAGGYAGNGSDGVRFPQTSCSGSGGAGGGASAESAGGGGGGVGLLGQGASGAGVTWCVRQGNGGSGGANGSGGTGGAYGGGGGGGDAFSQGRFGGVGAVRIIYPGASRSFPSTCTGNL